MASGEEFELEEERSEQTAQRQDDDHVNVPARGCLPCRDRDVRRAYRNVYGLGLSLFFLFSAFQSVQNLQSSVNARGGLGVISLSLLYAAFVLSGIVTTSIVKVLGTKYAVMGGMTCHLVYIVCNYYPTWYSLIPASFLIGFASGPLWAAISAHITQIAVKLAPIVRERQDFLISQFTGAIFLFTQVSHLPGNLASSLILLHASDATNGSSETAAIVEGCRNSTISASYAGRIKDTYWYILVSVFVLFDLIAIFILALLVDRLPSSDPFCSSKAKFKRFIFDPSVGLVQSFAFSVFAKEYVTDCLGLSQVGFVLMVLGLSNALTSGVVGIIVKYVPRLVIVLIATSINVGLIMFLLLWERIPSYLMAFLFAIGWGFTGGVWNTLSSSFVGILYPTESEPAYSVARMWQAFGLTVGFVMSYFDSQAAFLYLLLGLLLITTGLYMVVEFKSQSRTQIFPCLVFCIKETAAGSVEEEELVTRAES
eukprot:Em0015g811a